MEKVDLEEMKMHHGPYKNYPIYFMDYPHVSKMLENFMPMVEELEKLRKVGDAARKIAYVNQDGHGMRSSNSRDYYDLDKLIKEWKGG